MAIVREFLDEDELNGFEIGNAIIKPRQTRHYPCNYWDEKRGCTVYDVRIREKEKKLKANWNIKANRKNWTGEKPCDGIKEDCEHFDYPEPHIPTLDPNFVFDEEMSETISFALQHNDNLLIVGPTGCGKSSHLMNLCSLLNAEVNRFSCYDGLTSSKLIGQWIVVGDDMVWVDGHVTDAFRWGKILLEEEADFMDPALRGELHTVMEDDSTITLHTKHPKSGRTFREVIHRHPEFRWCSTANTIGLGDDTFMYHGVNFVNAAARDRYAIILQADYPHEETEINIVFAKANLKIFIAEQERQPKEKEQIPIKISKDIIENIVKAANATRDATRGKQCNFPFTIRRTINFAKYWVLKGPEKAVKLTIMNFCSSTDKITVSNFIETYTGIKAN